MCPMPSVLFAGMPTLRRRRGTHGACENYTWRPGSLYRPVSNYWQSKHMIPCWRGSSSPLAGKTSESKALAKRIAAPCATKSRYTGYVYRLFFKTKRRSRFAWRQTQPAGNRLAAKFFSGRLAVRRKSAPLRARRSAAHWRGERCFCPRACRGQKQGPGTNFDNRKEFSTWIILKIISSPSGWRPTAF